MNARPSHLAVALTVSVTLGLVGCASGADPGDPAAQTGSESLSRSCGASPGGGVQGVDVSEFQGNFDWQGEHARGTAFGYARISDGLGHVDPTFDANWGGMRAAGVLRGAYQFFEPGEDETAQANMMVQKVGHLGNGDLPAMIDVEKAGVDQGTYAAKIRTWAQIVEQGTGKKPIVYTGSYFWEANVNANMSDMLLWIAAYGPPCPLIPGGWNAWAIWQYSDGNGDLDHDVWNGSFAELQALAGDAVGENGCSAEETKNCGGVGCACVDHACSGGFCPGTGCTAKHTLECAAFGAACVDGQCSGGFGNGQGCTAKEEIDCGKVGCGCVDHQCNGGFCAGTGCTVAETNNCGKFGCGCEDGVCNGGYCGCSAKKAKGCAGLGLGCQAGKCK